MFFSGLPDSRLSAVNAMRPVFRSDRLLSHLKKPSPARFLILLFLLYYIPVILLVSGAVPFSFRWMVLAVVFLISLLLSRLKGYRAEELGIRVSNLKQSLLANTLFIICIVALFLLLDDTDVLTIKAEPPKTFFFFFYVLISSPLQEFLFRSFLFAEMNRSGITRASAQVVVSAASFAFLHIIYLDAFTTLATFAAGLVFAGIYRKYPNLAGVSLSHAVIGTLAILAGIARKMS
ncbi:Abortive infection protein [Chlorobium limicola DSM 245]|uniref:Abortive infection protein n=2 Tax=Chlorobium limicola TaxID=1092 RepID=B3EDC9_CHLL2|nr:Abortive infection protein [Chlorobium limicola DSM 245]